MRSVDWSSDVCSSDLNNAPWGLGLTIFASLQVGLADRERCWSSAPRLYGQSQGRRANDLAARPRPSAPLASRRADHHDAADYHSDRKSVVYGKSVSVRVDLGGRRIIKKKIKHK